MIHEKTIRARSGLAVLLLLLGALALAVGLMIYLEEWPWILPAPIILFLMFGLFIVNPNEGRVLQFFGRYVGTVKDHGLRWANPFYTKRRISLRVRNFETERSKVNDTDGNPIEMAAVVVWKVTDTAEATFEVDDYVNFVHVQSESAVRNLATQYPYDTHEEGKLSLRTNTGGNRRSAQDGDPGPARQGRRGGYRGPHHPPGVRSRDCLCDAAAAAGGRHHRRPAADCRGRRKHGADGA